MDLQAYLDRENISSAEFGRRIGRSRETVRRYLSRERIPDREAMAAITQETKGAVSANDFYQHNIPAPAPASAEVA